MTVIIGKNCQGIGGMGGKSEFRPLGVVRREIICSPFGVISKEGGDA